MDERSNWARALDARASQLRVSDLIRIGVTCGIGVAERTYYSLSREPITAQGERIDWLVIRAEIVRQRTAAHLPLKGD